MAINSPYPDDELRGYCQGNMLTGDTWSLVSQAPAHVAIVIRIPKNQPPARDAVLLAGRIACAFNAHGILWSAARSVFPPDQFCTDFRKAMSSGEWPHQVMIAVNRDRNDDDIMLHTRGLFGFVHHELSLIVPNNTDHTAAAETLQALAGRILMDTPNLKTGSTLPPLDEEDCARHLHTSHLPDGTLTLVARAQDPSLEPDATPGGKPAPIRARILHKQEKVAEAPPSHRTKTQRNTSRLRDDPRNTIEDTLAAIRAAAKNAAPKVKTYPRWMFWKKIPKHAAGPDTVKEDISTDQQ